MDSEILKQINRRLESGTCTPLEIYNLKMYVAINLDRERFTEVIKKQQEELREEAESRIRIIRWQQGTHFYAKVDNKDVVDENGNQKWNTHAEAMRAAKKYLITG